MTKLSIPHDAWVVIADSEKALFMRNEGDEKYPNLQVFREMEQDNPPTHEQGDNPPGRFNDGPNVHRSAVEQTDWHRLAKERFASDLAEKLYDYAHKGKFEKLIICAAPLVLGELRKELHQEVSDKIIAEIDKNLTNMPVIEIEKHLQAA